MHLFEKNEKNENDENDENDVTYNLVGEKELQKKLVNDAVYITYFNLMVRVPGSYKIRATVVDLQWIPSMGSALW